MHLLFGEHYGKFVFPGQTGYIKDGHLFIEGFLEEELDAAKGNGGGISGVAIFVVKNIFAEFTVRNLVW
jgi:hypothetical protein